MIPKRLVALILDRDAHRCVINGPHCTHVATVADHRVNRGHGGSHILDDPANLIGACWPCNSWKEDATGDALMELRRRGVRVRPGATHEHSLRRAQETPVIYPHGTVCMLRSDGSRLEVVWVADEREAS